MLLLILEVLIEFAKILFFIKILYNAFYTFLIVGEV